MIALRTEGSSRSSDSVSQDWLTQVRAFAQKIACDLGKQFGQLDFTLADTDTVCEDNAVDMLVFTCQNNNHDIQQILNASRNLRIPYIILTPCMTIRPIEKGDNILIPVTMFEEELSKAEIATSFGRFCGTHTTLLQANDYGTRAEKNIGKITTLIEKFNLPYTVTKGSKDSYRVELEAAINQPEHQQKHQPSLADAGKATRLLVITASRDYGLDDLIFGPKERKIIKKAAIPVLLLNPRGDLYSLCD